MTVSHELIDRYYAALSAHDLDAVLALYADGAEIVRYDGVATTPEEMRGYFEQHLARHPGLALRQIDQVREADDVVIWDALLDTEPGILQVFHVMMLDDDGKVRRHVPGIRGYWGA